MTARNHHYLPQCYLKAFAPPQSNKPQVLVLDARDRRRFVTSIRNVAAERDFNRVDIEGHAPDALEGAFAQFESDLAPALEGVIASGSLEREDHRTLLLSLLGLIVLRNPRTRRTFADFQSRVLKQVMQLAIATPERWAAQLRRAHADGVLLDQSPEDYEELKNFVDSGEYDIITPVMRHIQLELDTFDKILPLLFQRNWTVIRAAKNSGGFITCDHPACLVWTDPDMSAGSMYPPGLGLRHTALLFPLSPEIAIVGSFEGGAKETHADVIRVAEVNSLVASFARRQVYARDDAFVFMRSWPTGMRAGTELLNDELFLDRSQSERGDE